MKLAIAMLRAVAALVCVMLASAGVSAQTDYPSRPVRILVNSAPGGGTDIVARVLAAELGKSGAQFYVENRGGAGGIVGIETAQHAEKDGSTILLSPGSITILPAVTRQARYDAERDFIAITQIAGISNVLVVHPAVPAKTVPEYVALAKARPGEQIYASAGVGSSPHMSMELFKHMAGLDIRHLPFRGTGPAMTEVIAGRVGAIFSNLLTAKPLIEGGQLRALALSGPKRLAELPALPTVGESVPGYAVLQWYGLFAPAGTPQPIIARLHAMCRDALQTPAVRERLARDNAEPIGNTPAEFAALVKSELAMWARLARAANIQAE